MYYFRQRPRPYFHVIVYAHFILVYNTGLSRKHDVTPVALASTSHSLTGCFVGVTTARGRYGDTRYIYSMTAPPIPYVMSEAAAQSGRPHHDIHTPTHGTSQFSMKELYDIMRTNIFSSDSDEANARGQDDIVNQHSSLLANADVGQRNSSLDGFGTTAESENVAPAPSDGADRYVL